MPRILVNWIFLIGILWTSSTLAVAGIMVSAVEPPAWMGQGDRKTALAAGNEIEAGTRLLTGVAGKLEVQFDPGASLQLDVNSEIELVAAEGSDTVASGSLTAIKIHQGRACAQFAMQPDTTAPFNLLVGDSVEVTIREQGHICVTFNQDGSSIVLNTGTVQITNLIEPAMVVLSEKGSEYRFDDTGYFELNKVENALSIGVRNTAAKTGTQSPGQATAGADEAIGTAEPGVAANDAPGASPPAGSGAAGTYVYTVYLFSTRSQEVASEVNQKLMDAGHKTLIISSEDGAATRYRIAVSDFSSRQAAQDFAAAIVGKYGIADTWIGRQKAFQ